MLLIMRDSGIFSKQNGNKKDIVITATWLMTLKL